MNMYGGVDVYSYAHVLLTSALVGGEWSASRPSCFIPGEKAPATHWIGGWVDSRAGLDDMEEKILLLLGLKIKPIASRYTNCTLPAPQKGKYKLKS
jgi:hypothetical protein